MSVGKQRSPIAVLFLSFVTLGVYFMYWYYKVNAEVHRHEPRIKVRPGVALLAVTLGAFLFIPPFVSFYNTAVRIQKMQIADRDTHQISPLITFILLFFFGIGYVVQVQSNLNAHWVKHEFEQPEILEAAVPGLEDEQPPELPRPFAHASVEQLS